MKQFPILIVIFLSGCGGSGTAPEPTDAPPSVTSIDELSKGPNNNQLPVDERILNDEQWIAWKLNRTITGFQFKMAVTEVVEMIADFEEIEIEFEQPISPDADYEMHLYLPPAITLRDALHIVLRSQPRPMSYRIEGRKIVVEKTKDGSPNE